MSKNQKTVSEITNNVNTEKKEKLFTSKLTGVQLTEQQISDMLNESEAIKKSSENNEYNYGKIADNLPIICKLIAYSLDNETILDIQKNRKQFIECKTKIKFASNPVYAKVKNRIRMKIRETIADKERSKEYKTNLLKIVK